MAPESSASPGNQTTPLDDDIDELRPRSEGGLVVVGIGASAGGLEAITSFFKALPPDPGVAFVVVQHLSPDFKSHMPELLERHTSLPIRVVESGMQLQQDEIFLLPPGNNIRVDDRRLLLQPKGHKQPLSFPIDIFFESLAREYGPRAVAVVLSGSGSDGSRGVIYVKEAGGLVIAQTPDTAQFDGMPSTAIATEAPDYVLAPNEMPSHLLRYLAHNPLLESSSGTGPDDAPVDLLEEVTSILAEKRNHDFSGYRTKPLMRRILRRMSVVHARNPQSYLETLRVNQLEVDTLFSDLLINVTSFFRNEEAFKLLEENVFPELLEIGRSQRPLRIWVAGCSTGEEIYTLMVLFEEALLAEEAKFDYRIFATDVDQEALAKASAAVYPESALVAMDSTRRDLVFELRDGHYAVKREVRNKVVFAPHDLTNDPPFTRIDLVLCRNVLIYFRTELQEEVLRHLHFALSPGGFLFLGHSESLGAVAPHFNPIDLRWKIWRKTQASVSAGGNRHSTNWTPPARPSGGSSGRAAASLTQEVRRPSQLDVQRAQVAELESVIQTFMRVAGSCLVVTDTRRDILQVFGDASRVLQVASGRASLNLLDLVSPTLKNALGSAFRRAMSEEEPVVYRRVHFESDNTVDLTVSRIEGRAQRRTIVVALFQSRLTASAGEEVDGAARHAAERLHELEEEVKNLQQELRGTLEDASTTSEELQAANEELMASNEELQGTNEELQSVNEELHTINAEHQQKIQELAKLSEDMENLLRSTGIGTVFLDNDLRIRKFTPSVGDIVPLMVKDIGRPIGHIAPRIPGVDLETLSRSAIDDATPIERRVTSDRGDHFLMRVHPYRATEGQTRGAVLTFVDLRVLEAAEATTGVSRDLFQVMDQFSSDVLLVFDARADALVYASPRCIDLFKFGAERLSQDPMAWLDAVHLEDRDRVRARRVDMKVQQEDTIEYRILAPDGTIKWISDRRFRVGGDHFPDQWIAVVMRDVTEARENVRQLRALASALDFQANSDALTSLANRRGMTRELQRELERARRGGTHLVGVQVRLAGLEAVNRLEGYSVGDALLKMVAEGLTAICRPFDHVGRIGGDQFLLLMRESDSEPTAPTVSRLRQRLKEGLADLALASGDVEVECSVDAFRVPSEAHTIEELIASAERHLARQPQEHPGQVRGDRISHLVDSESYHALGQSIIDVSSGATVGIEMFSRSTITGLTQPMEFFEAAQSLKIQQRVDLTCLQVCASAAAQQDKEQTVHLNVLPSTLLATPSSQVVNLLREQSGLKGKIVLELSTSQRLADPERLGRRAEELGDHDIRLGLDDVGLGRGSVDALVTIAPSLIKIDGSLFRQALRDPSRRGVLERVLHLSRSLAKKIVAEGIESESELDLVKDLGIDFAQGYFWGHPFEMNGAKKN